MSSFTLIKQQQCIYFHQAASNFHVILQTMCTCSDHLNRFSSFAASKIETVQCWSLKSSVLSVLVDPKYPYSMKLRQLWEEDAKERARVDEEMRRIVFCVETCKNISVKKESERERKHQHQHEFFRIITHTHKYMIKQKYMTHRKFRLQVRIFGFSFSVFGQPQSQKLEIHHNNFKQNYKSKNKKKILTNFWNQSQKNYHWIQPIKGDHTSLTSTIKSYESSCSFLNSFLLSLNGIIGIKKTLEIK